MDDEPGVATGMVSALRLYDVASEIDLARVEREVSAGAPTRVKLTQARPKAISYGEPPIGMSLGRTRLEVKGDTVEAEVSARVYDFGTVTIAFRIAAQGMPWAEYVGLVNAASAALTSGAAWTEPLQRMRALIGPALDRPTMTGVEEDYVIATVSSFDRPLTADEVLETVDVARLLSGESRPLSRGATEDLLRKRFSYHMDDLVVLTWDRAFVLEPRGDTDVGDVLEVANAQLLELRYYDAFLDDELPRMYDRIEQARAGLGALSRRRYADLARRIQTRVAEVTEIAERVDNALIVTEDVYLARVYGAAIELFRVPQWQAAVDRKLSIMRETYSALFDEASTARAEYLEAAIVLLIVLDIVLAFIM